MKTKKEPKTEASELEVVDDIFMVEKDSRKLIGLKPDIKEAPENMIIPDGIEVIGKGAFLSNRFQHNNIKSVKFPDSLKKIEEETFYNALTLQIFSSEMDWNTLGKAHLLHAEGLKKSFFLIVYESLENRLL